MRAISDRADTIRFRRRFGGAAIGLSITVGVFAIWVVDPALIPSAVVIGFLAIGCTASAYFIRSGGLRLLSEELVVLPKGFEIHARYIPYASINRAEVVLKPRFSDGDGNPIDRDKGMDLSHESWVLRVDAGLTEYEVSHQELPDELTLADLRNKIAKRVEIATGRRLD